MMGVKLLWDYVYYWGILSPLYFRKALTDPAAQRGFNKTLSAAQTLNAEVQARLRARAEQRLVLPANGAFLDQHNLPALQQVNHSLVHSTREQLPKDLGDHLDLMRGVKGFVEGMLSGAPGAITDTERHLVGDFRSRLLGSRLNFTSREQSLGIDGMLARQSRRPVS